MAKDKKDKKDKGDAEPSNLIPAVIVAVGFILFGKFAAGSGGGAPAAVAVETTAAAQSETTTAEGHSAPKDGETTVAETPTEAPADTSAPAEVATTEAPKPGDHWTYDGDTGPVHWADLSPDYATCADGTKQSPIDIKNPTPVGLTDIGFDYKSTKANVIDNGHALQVLFDPASGITVDGVRYDLKQAHFHTPSEHTFDGTSHAAELHLVHADADGNLAVVALIIDEGDANKRFDPIMKAIPTTVDSKMPAAGPVELSFLLPDDRSAIRYEGSLTTPPCSETVQWLVIEQPITMSAEQIAIIAKLHPNNVRPPQPLNGRPVLADTGKD